MCIAKIINYLFDMGPKTISGAGLGSQFGDVEKIHKDNIDFLLNMPEDEILEERERILATTGK